jgi:hypothetical protein
MLALRRISDTTCRGVPWASMRDAPECATREDACGRGLRARIGALTSARNCRGSIGVPTALAKTRSWSRQTDPAIAMKASCRTRCCRRRARRRRIRAPLARRQRRARPLGGPPAVRRAIADRLTRSARLTRHASCKSVPAVFASACRNSLSTRHVVEIGVASAGQQARLLARHGHNDCYGKGS